MLDQWLLYGCVDVLQRGVPVVDANQSGSSKREFILAPLLTAPMDGQQLTGVPFLKALLLVGEAEGRAERQVLTTLSVGAHKARRLGSWRQIMPRAPSANGSIAEVLTFFRAHARELLALPGERADSETEWLMALDRWCQLLQKTRRAIRRRPDVAVPATELSFVDVDDLPPTTMVIDIDHGADEPELAEGDDDEIEPLPGAQSPEAPPNKPRAQPKFEDELESIEGGEARRTRTGFRSALENQFLPWANRQLNPVDAATLMPEMRASLAQGQTARDSVGTLTFAFVTGQLIEQALEVGRSPQPDGSYLDGRTYMRYVAPQEGAWEPSTQQSRFMRPRATHVPLALPKEVADWLDERLPAAPVRSLREALRKSPASIVSAIRDWLSEVRTTTGGQQTLGRVSWWLPAALYRMRPDHVPPHLLCAINDGLACPSAYYRAYETQMLSELHRETLIEAGWSMPPAPAPAPAVATGQGCRWVGSQLNPEPEAVKHLWERVTRHFAALVEDAKLPLYKRHNAREIHEALSQMFQTFHRTVSDPMESLAYIDTDQKRMVVDDKSQGDARAHRLIPLTTLAVRQCLEQIDHVRRLSVVIATEAPETAQRLVAMIEHPECRVAPFRFLLNERLEIVRLTPKAILREIEGIWDLPVNLGRHFGSTWLLEFEGADGRLASDESLCSLLGHHDLGTQNLSLLSPRDFETLYAPLIPRMEAFVEALGLRSIPSFLPEIAVDAPVPRSRKRHSEMSFGHRRREQARERQRAHLQGGAEQWIQERLGTKSASKLTQDDVDALFERVRKATPNRRNYWANERFEAMRAAIVDIVGRFEDLKLELPAIALAIRDVSHICGMDGLEAAKWVDRLRQALAADHVESFRSWRTAKSSTFVMATDVAVLSLVVDSLIVDPAVWQAWHSGPRVLDLFVDNDEQAWVRMPLPAKNSRLYPVRRDLAERLACIKIDAWQQFELESVAELARILMERRYGGRDGLDFWQLLSRIQGASAARMPGIALGYADGSHGSVSPERMCLERAGGLPPTVEAVTAWEAQRPPPIDAKPYQAGSVLNSAKERGSLTKVDEFRERMSLALRTMERTPAAQRTKTRNQAGKGRPADTANELAAIQPQTRAEEPGAQPITDVAQNDVKEKSGRGPGPVTRFQQAIESQWSDLVNSPQLPPAYGLAAQWAHHMAAHGKANDVDYAPKTIRNYWYSWALRFIEEFGPMHPRQVSSSECEEIYLQIVEDADVKNRQHLYAPMRSFHRYLVLHHGVAEIDWSQLSSATGQGLTYVDANLVHEHEYLAALDLLRGDEAVSERVGTLQAAVLILLYRFGLRIAECLGLQAKDVIFDREHKRWLVRVRGNQYRSLKTHNARRTVVGLEALTDTEHNVLEAWAAHVETFAPSNDIRPLFAASATGEQRGQLFPRRVVALRVGQALRAATGDPSIRVHHCRHGYATRMLLAGLGQLARLATAEDRREVQQDLMLRLREVLTGESDSTRRLIWAIAVQLGHGSPLTTLETYAHGGHLILRQWCADSLWASAGDVDAGEWMAWSTGTTLRTMQRDAQRTRLATADERVVRALGLWSHLPRLGNGPRASTAKLLPALRLVEGSNGLVSADVIIDHARRFGHVDGLAERLFVSELWVESVLFAAREFASRHRTQFTPVDQWWIESSEVDYPAHETDATEAALEALQAADPNVLEMQCQAVAPYFVPSARMVVVESEQTLLSAAALARSLVDDSKVVQLLVPAKLPRRLTEAERERRDNLVRRRAELLGRPYKPAKPRLLHERGIEFEGADRLIARAEELGLSLANHGRTAGAREDTHDWRRAGARLGLRIKENGYDRVRSAKVFSRVLASAIVASTAKAIAEADRGQAQAKV